MCIWKQLLKPIWIDMRGWAKIDNAYVISSRPHSVAIRIIEVADSCTQTSGKNTLFWALVGMLLYLYGYLYGLTSEPKRGSAD